MIEIKAEINHSLYSYSDISHSENKMVILTDLKQGFFTRIKCQELGLLLSSDRLSVP